jgi:hypothetical protein
MKAKLFIVAIALLIATLILGSCTFRTCPTYAKATIKSKRI